MTPDPYQPSWRRTAGAFLILALIALWVGLIVHFSDPISRWPALAQGLFYVAAGLAWIWILPLRRILAWSETGRWKHEAD